MAQIQNKIMRLAIIFVLILQFFYIPPSMASCVESPSNPCYYRLGTPGLNAPIAIDKENKVHIVFLENQLLKHGVFISGEWQTEIVRSVPGTYSYISLAIDGAENIHVSAYDQANDLLLYAKKVGTEWTIENLIEDQNKGLNSHLAVSPEGSVFICYTGKIEKKLYLITNISGTWVSEILDDQEQTGLDADIVADSSSNIHLAYKTAQGLCYLNNLNGSWNGQIIESGDLRSPSLKIDKSDHMHISYQKITTECSPYDCRTSENLFYASNKSGDWIHEIVNDYETDGKDSSIAVDEDGYIHIISKDYDDVRYSTNRSGAWLTGIADDGLSCSDRAVSFGIDKNGNVHFSYLDYSDVDPSGISQDEPVVTYLKLKTESLILHQPLYAKPTGSEFSCYEYFSINGTNIVSYKFSLDNGPYSEERPLDYEIKIDGLKKGPHSLSVIGKDTSGIWQSPKSGDSYSWTTDNSFFEFVTLGDTNTSNGGAVITNDASGAVHIIYFKGDNTLRYQTNISGQWVETIVKTDVAPSQDLAIAANPNGKVYIAFINNGLLTLVSNISGAWTTETLGDCEAYVSMTTDTEGEAHIAYYSDDTLYYATNPSGTWEKEIIRSVCCGINYISIAADRSNNIHVCSGNTTNMSYSKKSAGVWVHQGVLDYLVKADGDIGFDVDRSGSAHIVFYDPGDNRLKYTNNATGEWATESISFGYSISYDPKIRIDKNNHVHILVTNWRQIKYITKLDGDWRIETMDYDANLKATQSFSLDDSGQIHALYRLGWYNTLNYVRGFTPESDNDQDGIANYLDDDPYDRIQGDLNGDWKVDGLDLDVALKFLAGEDYEGIFSDNAISKIEVGEDKKIALEELIFILKKVSP